MERLFETNAIESSSSKLVVVNSSGSGKGSCFDRFSKRRYWFDQSRSLNRDLCVRVCRSIVVEKRIKPGRFYLSRKRGTSEPSSRRGLAATIDSSRKRHSPPRATLETSGTLFSNERRFVYPCFLSIHPSTQPVVHRSVLYRVIIDVRLYLLPLPFQLGFIQIFASPFSRYFCSTRKLDRSYVYIYIYGICTLDFVRLLYLHSYFRYENGIIFSRMQLRSWLFAGW